MPEIPPGADAARLLHQTLLGDAWENAREAVVVFDDARNYIAFNAAYCELPGYSRDEIRGMKVGGSLVADDESHDVFAHLVRDPGAGIGRAVLRRSDGSLLPVRYRMVETTVAKLPYIIALVWRDQSD